MVAGIVRRLFLAASLLLAATVRAEAPPRPATADEIAFFRDALKNSSQDIEHWAYTETGIVHPSKGRDRGETVVRFDPSKPYAEQFTPLQVAGKPPSAKQLEEYRRRGEKRGERVARAAEAARNPGTPPPRLPVGPHKVTLDPEHPLVVGGEGDRIIFEVPVMGWSTDVPVEKFQVLVVANRTSRLVERTTLRIRESFRAKLIAKVNAGEASMDFKVVDPKYPPVIDVLTGDFGGSFLFIPVSGTFHRTRTDWKRVKSYDERLQVKIGPLQLLDF